MKRRSAFVVPAIAAVLAGAIVAFIGPFHSPPTRAASSLTFEATFATAGDFYDRFDYGWSGVNPVDAQSSLVSYHGDHNAACEAPTTSRDVQLSGTGANMDFSQAFWHCTPGGDPAKGHVMTGVNTFGYNHAWFSPKPAFTGITKVCWDINETSMSSRKWTKLQFVGEQDAHRYPAGTATMFGPNAARGTGGFDLGYDNPNTQTSEGPTNGIQQQGGTLAGLSDARGIFDWFQNGNQFTSTQVGWPGRLGDVITDKAARYKHCLSNNADNTTMTMTEQTPSGERVHTITGQIPQDARRVVFHDSNYDPPKADNYDPNFLTWHWDNIQVFTDSDAPPVTTAPPTTAPPTTAPPTTTAPTTAPPTTTAPTTAPPTTTPPTTAPPTTTPPTTAPPTTTPPTTTAPPTTTPPTTEPPPTTAPPTTTPPTTAPPTTEPPPTTAPPTTTEPPPTTAPPGEPGVPLVTITSGPDEMTTDPNAEITFEVQSGLRTEQLRGLDRTLVLCSLDGQRPRLCKSPVQYKRLGLGEHEVVVTAYQWRGGSLLASRPFTTGSARHSWTVVDEATLEQAAPSPDSGVLASEATSSGTPSVQRTVLSFTGAHSMQIAVFGLLLIALGVALGSVAAVARRQTD